PQRARRRPRPPVPASRNKITVGSTRTWLGPVTIAMVAIILPNRPRVLNVKTLLTSRTHSLEFRLSRRILRSSQPQRDLRLVTEAELRRRLIVEWAWSIVGGSPPAQ